jgi:type I restriction enzyme S subunit
MYPLAPVPLEITRDYLFYVLLTRSFTEYAIGGSARAGMPKVNRTHLFRYKVWLPDMEQQRAVTEKLDSLSQDVGKLDRIYQRKLTALDELKKSLLHQAFTGQLSAAA